MASWRWRAPDGSWTCDTRQVSHIRYVGSDGQRAFRHHRQNDPDPARLAEDDLSAMAHVSRAQIGRIEHGHIDSVRLGTLRNVCAALEIRVDLVPRWRGGDLDRTLSSRHALLAESVVQALRRDSPEWQLIPEASFSIWGERGVIDLLAWHPGRRALLVIELKTELVDVGETLGTMDRKQRLAAQVAAERGWEASTVSGWIILAAAAPTSAASLHFARLSVPRIPLTRDGSAVGSGTRSGRSLPCPSGTRQIPGRSVPAGQRLPLRTVCGETSTRCEQLRQSAASRSARRGSRPIPPGRRHIRQRSSVEFDAGTRVDRLFGKQPRLTPRSVACWRGGSPA